MKKHLIRGFTGIELAAAIVVVGAVLMFGKSTLDKMFHRTAPSAAQVALIAERASAAKTGQQFASATTKEVSLAKDQNDPAIIAAKKTAARADLALQTGLGALTPSQAQWVQNLVEADAAAFNIALASKDAELAKTGDNIVALEKKVAAESNRASWLENLVIILAVIFVLINFVLPWLERIFPIFGVFVSGVQAVANPYFARLKVKAKAELAAAEVKAQALYNQVGQAVTDMRAKMGSTASAAIEQLDNNLDTEHANAISEAARVAAAASAAAKASAAAQVQIVS